jgi:uncharacterized protein DUF935
MPAIDIESSIRPLDAEGEWWGTRAPVSIIPPMSKPVAVEAIPTKRMARMSGWAQPANLSQITDLTRMQSAFRAAERGRTELLFTLYRDYCSNNSHIVTELGKRLMVVCSEPCTVIPFEQGNAQDQKAADACMKMIDLVEGDGWMRAMKWLLHSCFYPMMVCEKLFEQVTATEEGINLRWRLKNLSPVNPLLYCYYIPYVTSNVIGDDNPKLRPAQPPAQMNQMTIPLPNDRVTDYNPDDWEAELRFWSTFHNGMIDYSWADVYRPEPDRHLVHRGNFTIQPDNFGGPGRSCLVPAIMSVIGRDHFAKFMENFGKPIPVFKVDMEQRDVVAQLQNFWLKARELHALFVNQGAEVDKFDVRVDQGAAGHAQFIGHCQDEISKVIVGQTLSTSAAPTGMGSGVAKLQGEVRDDIRRFDHLMMATTLEKGLLRQFLMLNGISGRVRVSFGGLAEADVKLLAQSLQLLQAAGMELTDNSIEGMGQRIGFRIQRIAPERLQMTGPKGDKAQMDAPKPENN